MLSIETLIALSLKDHVRVNTTTKTVEFYDEFGVKLVLRDLKESEYEAYKTMYQNY